MKQYIAVVRTCTDELFTHKLMAATALGAASPSAG